MECIKNIDWNEVWTWQTYKHSECRNSDDCTSIWEDKENARKFWQMSSKNDHERSRKIISSIPITQDSNVLDIGAGPGSLAIPLCKIARHVTAIEPSAAMLEVLRENVEEHECNNITCVEKKWEDVNIETDLSGPYDIVIASFSLGMPDIRKAVETMQAVCSGQIYLYWFAGDRPWDPYARELWPLHHGKEYHSMPKCDTLYNVLYQMGIYPNIETMSFEQNETFSSLDEAVEHFGGHMGMKTAQEKEMLGRYLSDKLEKENGTFVHKSLSNRVRIWWNTQEN
ncbi:class I SAM-dependent methyltransferase [Methanolobus psychrotolerans]|uniref:class I SAM-dependent methyltransferase n=1 Tax=Methanolobus psychrotolerans TaxID=1874706 RepID=UPI000B91BBC3|nr:class I SAM-dependent methyltransferase [Methanolobus psychrotolerans]